MNGFQMRKKRNVRLGYYQRNRDIFSERRKKSWNCVMMTQIRETRLGETAPNGAAHGDRPYEMRPTSLWPVQTDLGGGGGFSSVPWARWRKKRAVGCSVARGRDAG